MTIKAVIFDLDGTLWRLGELPQHWTEITDLQATALAPELARLGLGQIDRGDLVRRFWPAWHDAAAAPNPELREVQGATVMAQTLASCGASCGSDDGERLWQALHDVPFRYFGVDAFPDAAATLATLCHAGYGLAIATNRPLAAKILLRELRDQGLPAVFAAVVTSGDVGYRKPHPLPFETALGALGVQPEETVLVGDTYEVDVVPAATLGMTAVLKLNERPPDPGWQLAHHQVSSLAELLALPPFVR